MATALHRLQARTSRAVLRSSPSMAWLPARPLRAPRLAGVPLGAGLATLSQAMRVGTVRCREPARAASECPTGLPAKGGDDFDPLAERLAGVISGAVMQLGSAGLLGFCAGIALKRATTEAAYTVGASFILLQVLAYQGYIVINWGRIRAHLIHLVDVDGDGEVTHKDVLHHVRGLLGVLLHRLPSTSGFAAGLVYGFRWS